MPSSQELGSCGKKLAHTDQSRYLDHAEEVPAADQTRQQNTKAVLEPQTNVACKNLKPFTSVCKGLSPIFLQVLGKKFHKQRLLPGTLATFTPRVEWGCWLGQ